MQTTEIFNIFKTINKSNTLQETPTLETISKKLPIPLQS